MPRPFPILLPPPTEAMAVAYFAPLLNPIPVGTRVPKPEPLREMLDGYLRVEAGGGYQNDDEIMWDVSVILHAYSEDEETAESIIQTAVAYGGAAEGVPITAGGRDWYVSWAQPRALPSRADDPDIPNYPRYRAMVSWRVRPNVL